MTESGNQSAYALAANATPFGHLMSAPGPASYEAREHTAVATKGPSDYEAYYGPAPPGVLNADVMGQIARTNLQLPAYYQVRPLFCNALAYAPTFRQLAWRIRWRRSNAPLQTRAFGLCRARTFTWSASFRGVLPTLMTVSALLPVLVLSVETEHNTNGVFQGPPRRFCR